MEEHLSQTTLMGVARNKLNGYDPTATSFGCKERAKNRLQTEKLTLKIHTMFKKFALVLSLAASLVHVQASASTDERLISLCQAEVKKRLKDPASAVMSDFGVVAGHDFSEYRMFLTKKGQPIEERNKPIYQQVDTLVMGYVNAKNSYGAMTGRKAVGCHLHRESAALAQYSEPVLALFKSLGPDIRPIWLMGREPVTFFD